MVYKYDEDEISVEDLDPVAMGEKYRAAFIKGDDALAKVVLKCSEAASVGAGKNAEARWLAIFSDVA